MLLLLFLFVSLAAAASCCRFFVLVVVVVIVVVVASCFGYFLFFFWSWRKKRKSGDQQWLASLFFITIRLDFMTRFIRDSHTRAEFSLFHHFKFSAVFAVIDRLVVRRSLQSCLRLLRSLALHRWNLELGKWHWSRDEILGEKLSNWLFPFCVFWLIKLRRCRPQRHR